MNYRINASHMVTTHEIETLEARRLLASMVAGAWPDHYLVQQDHPLEVSASSGVLANDSDIVAGAGATLDSAPKHGLIQFFSDGSFRYEPKQGYTGIDRFTYRTANGQPGALATMATLVVQTEEPIRLQAQGDSVVTFNELMYHPRGNEPEWIEFRSQMSVDVDLSGWQLDGGVEYVFEPATVLPAGGYLVIATRPEQLSFVFGLDRVLGPWQGRLSNRGEEVRLVNRAGRVMDVLDYKDSGNWPVGADGSGASLAKQHASAATSDPANWIAGPQIGGTPGGPNSGAHQLRQLDFIPFPSELAVQVPQDGSLGTRWTDPDFDDSSWNVGNQPVWFDQESPASAPQVDSLRAYWTFDGNFDDASGNQHTGTPHGTRFADDTPSTLRRGQSIQLDGEDDFVSAVVDVSETSYSVSLWFRADTDNGQTTRDLSRGLFSVVTSDLAIQANNDRQIYFSNGKITSRTWFIETIRSTDLLLTDGQWHHVVHVMGGDAGGQQLYVDGQLVAEGTKSWSDVSEQTRVNIGFAYSARNRFYQGWVDDVSLWDEVLSVETVQALYEGVSPLSVRSYRADLGMSVATEMVNQQSTAYLRYEFVANAQLVDQLRLQVQYDDGFVAYLNGVAVADSHAPPQPRWNSTATASRNRADVFTTESLDLTPHLNQLRSGHNVLAIQVLNSAVNDKDFLFWARLRGRVRPFVPLSTDVRISEVSSGGQANFTVEIANMGEELVSLEGFVLQSSTGVGQEYVFPTRTIAVGTYQTFSDDELGFAPRVGDRLFLYSPEKTQLIDSVVIQSHPQARLGNEKRWLIPDTTTPHASNQFRLRDEIVINEIQYHAVPYYATESLPYIEAPTEWIELYNRSFRSVDLSDWALAGGVQFTFPADTVLTAGQYLVVANDSQSLALDFPDITILGDFSGRLSNRQDTVQLLDQRRNPVDEVTYFEAGRWPEQADGGGSTLELRDPNADNYQPEAWAASDENQRSRWQTISYRGVVEDDGFSEISAQVYHELVFGLLDAGEFLIDDISVIEDPNGARVDRIQNSSFERDELGGPAGKWRVKGNHQGIVVRDPGNSDNQVLHVSASGVLEDRLNHAETTFSDGASIQVGSEYEISFRAKWLAGSPQLNTHLFFNHLPRTTILQVPRPNGTPGRQNSRFAENVGPTYTGFSHSPPVPDVQQPVVVRVVADDPQEVSDMSLWFSVDGGMWDSVQMTALGDTRFEGTIPGHAAASVVQFYVEGVDMAGALSRFPAAGRQSRALYQVQDGQATDGPLRNFRIVMTPSDVETLLEQTNRMSNARMGGTVVVDESDFFYDVGIRLKGSSAGRTNVTFVGFNVQFDPMQLFRGIHRTVAIDRSGRSRDIVRGQDEIVVKHIVNHAGLPGMFDDLAYLIAPVPELSRTALLMLARYGDTFLDSQFAGGADGTVFKLDIAYIPAGTVDGEPESPKLPFPYIVPQPAKDLEDLGDDKERYRSHVLIRNNRSTDDFSKIIAATKALSLEGDELVQATADLIDVDQWARLFAIQSLTGIVDTYTRSSLHHNISFYVPPADGRIVVLPWDWDFAFTLGEMEPLFGSDSNTAKLLNAPVNRRLFHGHILDMLNTTFNNEYLDPWIDHYGQVLGQSYRNIKPYVRARAEFVRSELPAFIPFEITTSAGNDFDVTQPSVTLAGQGWIDVREIRLAGQRQTLQVTWTGEESWQTSLPLAQGVNPLTLEAYDHSGKLVGTDNVTITNTGEMRPLYDSLRVSEIHFNPGPPTAQEIEAGHTNNDDFEFLELINIGSEPLDLGGVELTRLDVEGDMQGVAFKFGESVVTALPAGGRVLIVEDTDAFGLRYGMGLPIAGQWSGGLDNNGELLTLVASGVTVQQFAYDGNWYGQADGNGSSLEFIAPTHFELSDWSERTSWRPSEQPGGSPGTSGLPGDVDGNQRVDVADIDRLHDEIHAATHSRLLDITRNGFVDWLDLDALILNILQSNYGDTNLDGVVDYSDFESLASRFGHRGVSWADGDFDGDGDVDFDDFNRLSSNFTVIP